jgi:hypothetical protein
LILLHRVIGVSDGSAAGGIGGARTPTAKLGIAGGSWESPNPSGTR